MIPSIPNPSMTKEDVMRFRSEMNRRINGDFTTQEREQYESARRTYENYMRSNGGKNPIFG